MNLVAMAASAPDDDGQGDLQSIDPLIVGILQTLCEAPSAGWVSLPRLGKRLGASGSEVLRVLNVLSDAQFGDTQGLGWVEVRHEELRWQARLTETGYHHCESMFPAASAAGPNRGETAGLRRRGQAKAGRD